MRVLLVGAMVLGAMAGTTLSVDRAYAQERWTGAQLGVLYGYSWMNDYNNALRLAAEGEGDVYGLYAAVTKQHGAIVGGAEVTYAVHENMFTDGSGVVVEDVFAAKLRAGVAIDRVSVYGIAGVTYGRTNLAGDDWGSVFGLGVDVLVTDRLVAGLQYNYFSYEDFNATTIDAQLSELTARVGVKF